MSQLKKLIIIGDRVLVKPKEPNAKTSSGLYLPPGVQERSKILSGYVMRVGPGYAVPSIEESEEPWMDTEDQTRFIPLQVKEGDLAIFLVDGAYEVMYEEERYYIVSQNAILMVEREEDLI